MIAQRSTGYNSMEMNEERTIQAVLALLGQRRPVGVPRWDCDVCGMIHIGQMPLACDSCGSHALSRQSEIHHEMNNHW